MLGADLHGLPGVLMGDSDEDTIGCRREVVGNPDGQVEFEVTDGDDHGAGIGLGSRSPSIVIATTAAGQNDRRSTNHHPKTFRSGPAR
jgi:hypothetical protein